LRQQCNGAKATYRRHGSITLVIGGSGAFCKSVKVNREVCWRYQKWECWHK